MKNRKNILLTSMLLATVTIAGVGYASWVIAGETSEEVSGGIYVDTLEDSSRSVTDITFGTDVDDKYIVFGSKPLNLDGSGKITLKDYGYEDHTFANYGWLAHEEKKIEIEEDSQTIEKSMNEDLTATVSFVVDKITASKPADENAAWGDVEKKAALIAAVKEVISLDFSLSSGSDKYTAAKDANLVGALPKYTEDSDTGIIYIAGANDGAVGNVTTNEDESVTASVRVTLRISFNWGSKFSYTANLDDDEALETVHLNPVEYYNSKDQNGTASGSGESAVTYKQEAKDILNGDVLKGLASCAYKLTITVTAAA